jgi:nitrogenase molybdenum-iron protein alpha/beta subunit
MQTIRIPILVFVVGFYFLTSCKTYQGFPKGKGMSQQIDYTDPNVQLQFEKGEVYKIWMDDSDREIEFILYEVKNDMLVGVVEKTDLQKTKYLDRVEIPFDRINHMKVKRETVTGTIAMGGVSLLVLLASITALSVLIGALL